MSADARDDASAQLGSFTHGVTWVRAGDDVRVYPAASPHEDLCTLVKFYSLSTSLVNATLQQSVQRRAHIDIPFRVSEQEYRYITSVQNSSVLLLGRSGTGKTTWCVGKAAARTACLTRRWPSSPTARTQSAVPDVGQLPRVRARPRDGASPADPRAP